MRRLAAVLVSVPFVLSALHAVPASGPAAVRSIVVEGHGWGHGLGMPQWGARGMADAKLRFETILHRYYSGVRIGTVRRGPRMRVLLDRVEGVRVTSARSYQLWIGGRRVARAAGTAWFRVYRSRTATRVERSSSPAGPWRYVVTTDRRVAFARGGAPFVVTLPGAKRMYRGDLVLRKTGGTLAVINEIPVEQYLLGVVPREMPASWPSAALQAQAVEARTYALRVREFARAQRKAWDICATAACQVYGVRSSRRSIARGRVRSCVWNIRALPPPCARPAGEC